MAIIDAHTHLDKTWRSVMLSDMDAAGVDAAFVCGVGGIESNDFIFESAREYPDRFIPMVLFDPRYEEKGLEEIEGYLKGHGGKIVKVGHQHANSRYMYPMMEKAQKYGAAVQIHSDHGIRNHPYIIGELSYSYPEVPMLIEHMGGGTSFDTELLSTKVAMRNPLVFLCTSFTNPYNVKKAIDTVGPDRVMYASDYLGRYAEVFIDSWQHLDLMLDTIRVLGLPKDQEEMVLGGNAAKLIGFDVK
jgi:predicted TIM-barrel fold metal-dependent hydrolase